MARASRHLSVCPLEAHRRESNGGMECVGRCEYNWDPACCYKARIPGFPRKSIRKEAPRAKGRLVSEPRFSTPCEMRFFPREKGKMGFVEGLSLKRPFSLSRVGKIASRRGLKIGAHKLVCLWLSGSKESFRARAGVPKMSLALVQP